ncbi:hypothetical protein AB0D38_36210, partial [Streptomyces sp. NPDC048279]|uniref:hypothetical protein n=1 Tax=Streptomyces sp. NPDC048279 TaxID=3154714 RepID=UPI0034475D8A
MGTTEEYWRQRFAAPAPETALPHDFPHPPRSRERGRPGRRTAALRTTADEATRLAAFVALLHRYGGAAATEMTVASGFVASCQPAWRRRTTRSSSMSPPSRLCTPR